MNSVFLLDTNIVIRWLYQSKKLSREQSRVLNEAVRQCQSVAVSAMTLLEIATMISEGKRLPGIKIEDLFKELRLNPIFEILPITIDIAEEIAALPSLRDPADMAIVATARVHRLRLLTSDQRIIESKLASVVE